MALDPRLAEPLVLALAARRAKERKTADAMRAVTLRVEYCDSLTGEIEPGPSYTYEVPVVQLTRPWRDAP
jgi:hypothetical protein